MRRVGIALVLVAVACGQKKVADGSGPAASLVNHDALWALAPEGTQMGVVVSDGTLARLQAAALTAIGAAEKIDVIASAFRSELRNAIPFVDILDPASVAAAGLDLNRGVAVFGLQKGAVLVLPVGDRQKLVAKSNGRTEPDGVDVLGDSWCKEVAGRYACASDKGLLGLVAKSDTIAKEVAGWPGELRGDVEAFMAESFIPGFNEIPRTDAGGLRIGVRIERGAFTARMHLRGKPSAPVQPLPDAPPPLAAGVADKNPVGLVLLRAGLVPKSTWVNAVPPVPVLGVATLREIAAAHDRRRRGLRHAG